MDMPIKGWVVPPFTRDTNMVISELENDVDAVAGLLSKLDFPSDQHLVGSHAAKSTVAMETCFGPSVRRQGCSDGLLSLAARHVGEFAEAGAIVAQRANMAPVHLLLAATEVVGAHSRTTLKLFARRLLAVYQTIFRTFDCENS